MSRRLTETVFLPLVLGLLLGTEHPVHAQPASARTLSTEAGAYLSEALTTIQQQALWADSVDWREVRRAVFDSAAGAAVPVDTYRAIRFALHSLGDRHSFLQLSAALREAEEARLRTRGLLSSTPTAGTAVERPPFIGRGVEGHLHQVAGRSIARVVVPRSRGMSTEDLATSIHDSVRALDAKSPCGWIVDLRGNVGGNMWPMLAGIGPLLGNGETIGSVTGKVGTIGTWYYRAGTSGMTGVGSVESFVGATIRGPAYRLGTDPPVAVLIDGNTGSSGEAVAVAFKGRPETRFFGTLTAGVSTSNQGFRLSDGANLVITVGVHVDRTGRSYPRDVAPDEEIPYVAGGDDPQVARAIDWLLGTTACKGRARN